MRACAFLCKTKEKERGNVCIIRKFNKLVVGAAIADHNSCDWNLSDDPFRLFPVPSFWTYRKKYVQ